MLVQMLLQNISSETLVLNKYNLSNSYLNTCNIESIKEYYLHGQDVPHSLIFFIHNAAKIRIKYFFLI